MADILYTIECPSCGILAENQTYAEARDAEAIHRHDTGHDPTITQQQ